MIDDIIFNRWKSEYIDNVDLDNIEYLNLTPNELSKFLHDNYLDKSTLGYVSSQELSSKPIGLVYLDYAFLKSLSPNEKEKRFLIGIVSNNKGTKTIVSVFKYYKKYFFSKEQKIPLTYILSVEVNEFFRKKGLYKKLIFESLNYINQNNPVIITIESEIGCEIGTINIIKDIYYSNGFDRDIRSIGECDKNYIEMINGNSILTKKRTKI